MQKMVLNYVDPRKWVRGERTSRKTSGGRRPLIKDNSQGSTSVQGSSSPLNEINPRGKTHMNRSINITNEP